MKKILSLALALVMVFGLLPMAFAAEEPTAEVSQYQEFIDFLKLPGINIYHGTAADEDGADEDVTRWQMALFVSRLVTGETEDDYWKTNVNDSGFTDVEKFEGSSEATLGAISFASQKGIVNGIGDGLFDPTADVTYQDAIVMIVRALGYNYKSSGYPWSYINKARELGVLEGISGIGYTQAAPRGVVAVLLYNAFFAKTEDGTVAEKVFNVGSGIVLITASNNVFFEPAGAKVTRSNYVQFKFLDDAGNLTGAAYHVPNSKFGLAGSAAADAAVGTTYFVYYTNGAADVIYAKPLTSEFWNKEGKNQISFSNPNLTLDGDKYRVVTQFSNLNRLQGSVTGADEIKMYQGFGGSGYIAGGHTQYLVAANGSIYDVTYSITDPIVYYNPVLDIYYEKDSAGGFNILSYDKVYTNYIASATSANGSFKQITTPTISAYTKAVVSDVTLDGEKMVTLRNYQFGTISFRNSNKYKPTDSANSPEFQLVNGNGGWELNQTVLSYKFNKDYRWTGLNLASSTGGTKYVIFYVDEYNREIEILKAFDPQTGYVRQYDALNNKISIEINGELKTFNYGYDNLTGSPIKTKGSNNANLGTNLAKVSVLVNQYVDFYMVDDKIVYIKDHGSTDDYVIIDKIVGYGQDGITVSAYTTVDNAYKEIKITEFNGWQLGAYDANYYFYFLAGLISGTNQNLLNPIDTYTLYKVMYVKNGNYNLITAGAPKKVGADFTIYDSGLMTGANGSNGFNTTHYRTVTASDYWLILVPEHLEDAADPDSKVAAKVAQYSGKLGASHIYGVDAYKGASNDFVLVAQLNQDGTLVNPNLLNDLNAVTMTNVKYMVYASTAYSTQYQYVYSASQALGYSVYMTNIQDGSAAVVTWNPYDATIYYGEDINRIDPTKGLVPGGLYMVVDNVVVGEYTGTLDQLAVSKFKVTGDVYVGVETITSNALNDVRDLATKKIAELIAGLDTSDAAFTTYANAQRGNVTVYFVAQPYVGTYVVDKNKNLPELGTGEAYTVAYIVHANGKADAWVCKGEATSTATATVTAYKAGTDDLDSTDVTVSATKDNSTGKYTVEITLPTTGTPMIAYDATADTAITVTADSGTATPTYAATYVASVKVEGATGTSVTVTIANRASGNDITITVTLG